MTTTMSGRYMIEKGVDPENMAVVVPWFKNLILNGGLNRLGTGSAMDRAVVGGGSTAPNVSETQLVSPIASTQNLQTITRGISVENGYVWQRYRYRFAAGVAAGNLSEVGVGWAGGLFSRALILDTDGVPTTITILSNEFLDVTYELRIYPPTADVNAVVNIAGVDYTTVLRAGAFNSDAWAQQLIFGAIATGSNSSGLAYTAGTLGSINVNPGGSAITNTTTGALTNGTYSNNSYEFEYIMAYSLAQGNQDFHALQAVTPMGTFKMSFSPPLPKNNTNILNLRVKVVWARR